MSYEVVFNVFLGILALMGVTLLIIFWLVFRNDKTIHPIYRSHVSPPIPKSRTGPYRWPMRKATLLEEKIHSE
jgi:hypothetical protein